MEDPDFDTLAASWIEGDPRTQDLEPEQRQRLIARMSQALEKRRKQNLKEQRGDLIVTVERSRLGGKFGLEDSAMDELVEIVQEVADKDAPDV